MRRSVPHLLTTYMYSSGRCLKAGAISARMSPRACKGKLLTNTVNGRYGIFVMRTLKLFGVLRFVFFPFFLTFFFGGGIWEQQSESFQKQGHDPPPPFSMQTLLTEIFNLKSVKVATTYPSFVLHLKVRFGWLTVVK